MENNKPNIFIIDDITKSYEQFIIELNSVISLTDRLNENLEQIQLKSYYLYGYALFESALAESYKIFLNAFPERIQSETPIVKFSRKFTGHSLLGNLIEEITSEFSHGLTYGKIDEVFKRFGKALNISSKSIDTSNLYYAKNIRNDIAHNKTIKKVELKTLKSCLIILTEALEKLFKQIKTKYKDYTKDRLRKDAWTWVMGKSALLRYEDHWELNANGDMICYNFDYLKKIGKTLSSSEKHILMLWMVNYSQLTNKYFTVSDLMPVVHIDDRNRIAFITELFNKYPLLLQ